MTSASRLKAFCDRFVSLFSEDGLAEINVFDKNCKIPFAVRFKRDSPWLPVTVRIAQADGRFAYLCSPQIGIIICYKSDSEIAILSAASCVKDRIKFELVKMAAYTLTSMICLYDKIKQFSDTNINASFLIIDISSRTSVNNRDFMSIEATSSRHILTLLGESVIKCPEGCSADFGFSPSTQHQDLLPLQLKSSSMQPQIGDFAFTISKAYDSMLVVMHHVTAQKGVLVVPGCAIPRTSVTGTWTGKYAKYLVKDDELQIFLRRMHRAIECHQCSFEWPAGDMIDISRIRFQSYQEIRTPVHPNHQQEHKFAEISRQNLPNICHTQPAGDGTCVDRLMDGVRIQDKLASRRWLNTENFHVTLFKSDGRSKTRPYDENDFDALYIHMPDGRSFYLIPAQELSERGYLTSSSIRGRTSLHWTPGTIQKLSWLDQFLYRYDFENTMIEPESDSGRLCNKTMEGTNEKARNIADFKEQFTPEQDIAQSENIHYPQINLGYCCISMTLRALKPSVYTNRTCVKKTFLAKGLPHVSGLALQNVRDLLKVLQWNEEHDIRLFRVSSDMFAFWSEYELEDLPDFEEISSALREVGDYAKEHGHRLTYHPGPYVVLGTPREDVAEKSIIELNRHSQVFDLMGFEPSYYNKCNLHVRGVYDSKIKAMDRFAERFERLSQGCQRRLTVECDDTPNAYSIDDLMYLHTKIGIPIVADRHHMKFCKGKMTDEEAFHAAINTWPKGIKPIVHWSESQAGRKPLAHSDYVDGPIAFFGCEDRVDVHIEAKRKDLALLRYRDEIAKLHH